MRFLIAALRTGLVSASLWTAGLGAGCAETVAVNKDFYTIDLQWDGGQITTYRGLWTISFDKQGYVLICGTGKMMDSNAAQPTMAWQRGMWITVNGKRIMKDISFFTKARSGDDLLKTRANCKSTGVKPPKGNVTVTLAAPPMNAKF